MTHRDTCYLSLSGAGLPSWIWNDVRALLPDHGRTVVGARPVDPRAGLSDYADAAVRAVPDSGPVVVIAHSIGGVVAGHVIDRLGDRATGLVAVSAVVPPPGRSFLAALPMRQRAIVNVAMRIAGTRAPASAVRAGVAAGLDAELIERIVTDMVAESPRLFRDTAATLTTVPAARYICTENDREIPMAQQHAFAATLGAPTISLPTGHLPMIQAPRAVAAVITEVASLADS